MRDPCGKPPARKTRNFFQTIFILAGMLTLFGVLGYMLMGKMGILWSASLGMVLMATTPKISPRLFLQRQGAVFLQPEEADGLYDILTQLSQRARILKVPKLYIVSSGVMNAFSMGRRNDAAVVLTEALIRKLNWYEIAGILAHEVGHIRNNDLFLHSLADTMTRVTSMLSTFGQILILLYLPLLFFSDAFISPVVLILLLFAPSISALLQLALSRTREFEADQTAAYLTSDPKSLAVALGKMDHEDKSLWEKVFRPRSQAFAPSLLRTHPHTDERVVRLLEMAREFDSRSADCPDSDDLFFRIMSVDGEGSRHWLKSWQRDE